MYFAEKKKQFHNILLKTKIKTKKKLQLVEKHNLFFLDRQKKETLIKISNVMNDRNEKIKFDTKTWCA